jgi:Iron-containing redox enzyme
MISAYCRAAHSRAVSATAIQERTGRLIDETLAILPGAEFLTAQQRRGIIARYGAVLEGNFIYWMTGAYLSARTDESRAIILENLHEEVRDCHPGMMRRFAAAAQAAPSDADFLAVSRDLLKVRLFVGRLSTVPLLLMMAFFEGWIQRFMAYLEDLAVRQGSTEREYTQVHGVCDIAHTAGLFQAVSAEMVLEPLQPEDDLFEGVELLRRLIHTIVTV